MSVSTRWGKWVVFWGIVDLYTFGRYFVVRLFAGEFPFLSDFKEVNSGCVRMSNPGINKLHQLMPDPQGTPIIIKKCQ